MAEEFGIKAPVQELDLQAIVARKNGVSGGVSGDIQMGMEGLLGNNSVEVVRGQAVLKSPTEVKVEDTILEAKRIILATGSSLSLPDVPGLEEAALTTDQVLEMTEVPSSVLIWGSLGPIEVEMATLLNINREWRCFLASPWNRSRRQKRGMHVYYLAQKSGPWRCRRFSSPPGSPIRPIWDWKKWAFN
jgi:hypothetical protein